jgi:hypothetical protein
MNETHRSPTALSTSAAVRPDGAPAERATPPHRPDDGARAPARPGRSITARIVGAMLVLISVILMTAGGTALWAHLAKRDAGYLTTDVQTFSSAGSALTTEPADLGPSWTGWLYSPGLLDEIRIRVTPVGTGPDMFVGIGPSADVDRYLAGVSHTHVSDFLTNSVEFIDGGAPASPPGTQGFWVASSSGAGTRTVEWEPVDGSWTVVVMDVDGGPGVREVETDLGARYPALPWIAVGVLAAGTVLLVGAVLLFSRGVRGPRAGRARTA